MTNPYGRAGRPTPPDHGTRARYASTIAPCHCGQCRAANAAYQRSYRHRTQPVDPRCGHQLELSDAWR